MQVSEITDLYRAIDVAAIIDGAQVLLDDGTYRVLCLNSAPASAWWGQGTRWCTTGPAWFDNYRTYGELVYIEHRPKSRRWLLYISKCEFRNARNRRANGQVFARQHPAVINVLRGRIYADFRASIFFGLTPDGAHVEHSLNLRHVPVLRLPERMTVRDDLDLRATGIVELPKGLSVGGDLLLSARLTPKMPADLRVRGRILRCDGYLHSITEFDPEHVIPEEPSSRIIDAGSAA